MERRLFVSLLFQPQNGPSNSGSILTTEKAEKMEVAEALDLSEKLVCAYSIHPLPSEPGPAVSVNPG